MHSAYATALWRGVEAAFGGAEGEELPQAVASEARQATAIAATKGRRLTVAACQRFLC
jgi:hypothetical protein